MKITFLASKDSVLEFTSYFPQFFFLLLIMVIETFDTYEIARKHLFSKNKDEKKDKEM